MKRTLFAAVFVLGGLAFSAAPAFATDPMTCKQDCAKAYNTCNSAGNQSVCMPKWMQCKRGCTVAPAKAPAKKS